MHELIVIGGGAAGFFAAVNAARLHPGAKILLLEKSGKLLSKVRVSGGGRCNVTHACFDDAELVKNYPRGARELRQAFSRFSTKDTIAWFAGRGVKLKTEADGRMFPVTDNSETVIDCLLSEAKRYGVEIQINSEVTNIEKTESGFAIHVNADNLRVRLSAVETGPRTLTTHKLLIATGGSPKSSAYDFIRALGHTIIEPVPSLFTFNMPGNPVRELMGLSVDPAVLRIPQLKSGLSGALLVTHWGMSGPAVLKASAWGARELHANGYRFDARVSWLPQRKEEELRGELQQLREQEGPKQISARSYFALPKRLWEFLLQKSGIEDALRWADLSNKQLNKLAETLLNDVYPVSGKTTFKEEFVTCGGVSLKEVDFKTMESRKCPGLFFAGEVLDIDGITGGFNFQSAWTTGWIASQPTVNPGGAGR